MAEKKKLGEMLLAAGVISAAQLKEALEDQKKYGGRLGSLLLDRRYIDEKSFLSALSAQLKIPSIDFTKSTIPEQVIHQIPQELQEKYLVFPVATKRTPRGNILVVAMDDPTNVEVLDELGFRIGIRVEPVIALERALRDIIREYWYHQEGRGSYHYKPDVEVGAYPAGPAYPTGDPRMVGGERVIDFAAQEKAQAESSPGAPAEKARTEAAAEKPKLGRELLALLRLLVRKKIISEQEFMEELKKTK